MKLILFWLVLEYLKINDVDNTSLSTTNWYSANNFPSGSSECRFSDQSENNLKEAGPGGLGLANFNMNINWYNYL